MEPRAHGSTTWLWLASLAAALALALAGLYPVDNPDTFGHLAAGRQIVALGHVPQLDTFSFFRSTQMPWVNYEWLSGLVFYGVYAFGGFDALTLFKLALLALMAVLLVQRGYAREGVLGALLTALLIVAAIPAARYRLTVRPQVFGMLLSSVYLLGLLRVTQKPADAVPHARPWAWVLALGLLHVLWVNLHGSHLFGLALTLITTLTHVRDAVLRRRLFALCGLQLLSSCVSPYGPRIVVDAILHVADPVYRTLVAEWKAWAPGDPAWLLIAVVVQCGLILVASRTLRRDTQRASSLLICALLAVMALRSLRFIADFVLLTAPLVAEGLAPLLRRASVRAQRVALSCAAALLCVAAPALARTVPPYAGFGLSGELREQPVASGLWLAQHLPHARVFAPIEDAWYLMWALPDAKFLVDGRVPFYGPAHMQAMMRAWADESRLMRTLDASSADVVVLQFAFAPHQRALQALTSSPAWRLVLLEDLYAVFARVTPARERLLRAAALQALVPRYDPAVLLSPTLDIRLAREELERLPAQNTQGYRAWVRGMLALRPLARDAERAGFAAPTDEAQRKALRQGLSALRSADAVLRVVPVVLAYHALVAVVSCELDEARGTLGRAETESRETLMTRQELALRSGQLSTLVDFLQQARALPEAKHDPWLAALERASRVPPLCPQ